MNRLSKAQRVVGQGLLLFGVVIALPVPSLAAPAQAGQVASVDRVMRTMTLQQKIGQMFMSSFDGTTAGPDVLRMVRDWGIGGLILYRPNVASGTAVRRLVAAAQGAARVPLLIATDEEGGSVAMVPFADGIYPLLAARDYGRLASAQRVYHDALQAGHDLRALGITMDLAPVLDVLLDPLSPIGARSYGSDPQVVARLGAAAIRGYQHAGIAATAKHFLGLGDVTIDAHRGLPKVERTRTQLETAELVPMRAAVREGVDALMVTHAALPALDATGTSASLSYPIISGFIRHTLGYRGVIISDSLTMGAIDTRMSMGEAAVKAASAGSDILLIASYEPLSPTVVRNAINAVAAAVATRRISPSAIDAAARRILTLKAKLGLLKIANG